MPSKHLILCHPLLFPPSVFPSIRVFSKESVLHIRWSKCWSFSFSISPSNKYSGLISYRIYRLDLLAVQGTLKSLLQHHNSSRQQILRTQAFFKAQLSHPYMTTGKNIALTIWTLLAKWCLFFLIHYLGLLSGITDFKICVLRVYDMMFWYTHTLWKNHHNQLINIFITSQSHSFCVW